jgi:ABC-type branched-subunit amino acid transport system substrate-binding protein
MGRPRFAMQDGAVTVLACLRFALRHALAGAVLCAAAGGAEAQIVVGQTAGFSGPDAALVKETTDGARMAFERLNKTGGVHGQAVRLVSLDDRGDPALASAQAQELVTQRKAVALFLSHGAAPTAAVRSQLDALKVPLVAPVTGADDVIRTQDPWLFATRATWRREAEKVVSYLLGAGIAPVGVVHANDAFGIDAATGAHRAFAQAGAAPAFVLACDAVQPAFSTLVEEAAKRSPKAVLFIGAAPVVADGAKALRAAGSQAQVATLSNNATAAFVRLMGTHARGTIVAQAFPSERSTSLPLVKAANALAVDKGLDGATPAMLEGYVGATVLVEGLKRAGRGPTGRSVRAALESMRRVDLGGVEIDYGASRHGGRDSVELSVVDADGRFKR